MATISEEKRIEFTKKLLDLRDDVVDELAFPPGLSNVERKFLHKISQDYGLKSKSQGKGDNRFITVRKHESNKKNQGPVSSNVGMPLSWIPDLHTVKLLSDIAKTSGGFQQCPVSTQSVVSRANRSGHHNQLNAKQHAAYIAAQEKRRVNKAYNSIQHKRHQLPAHEHKATVLEAVRNYQIVLISGETGCGKSTQVPQYLLDDEFLGGNCRIAITQPRRISAIAVAERIASERSESVGEMVGYNIRMESEKSEHTQVMFMTPGVLLRKLLNDPLLEEYTHVIVDEAHERDRFTEFLLIILRDICAKRADLKLVLMSATMHTDKLRAYFGDIPSVSIGGSVFPVQEFFLEDVLQLTNHMQNLNDMAMSFGQMNVSHGRGGGRAQQRSGAIPDYKSMAILSAPSFYCCICNKGPFMSPVELGTHTAFCFPPADGKPMKSVAPAQRGGGGSLMEKIFAMRASSVSAANKPQDKAAVATPEVTSVLLMEDAEVDALANQEEVEDEAEAVDEQEKENAIDALASNTAQGVAMLEGLGVDSTSAGGEVNQSVEALLAEYQSHSEDSQVDYELILSLLQYVFLSSEYCNLDGGSVLIFLPGWEDISRLYATLSSHSEFSKHNVYKLIQLHSSIPKKEQDRVFHALNRGEHKIILSTNIAETSITIDDVVVVINAGRVKEKTYDPHTKLAYLQSSWISQASARQRKGRAGRTQCGVCFHLYSRLRSKHLAGFQDSELLRMPLEELILQAKTLGVAPGRGEDADSVKSFLLKAMDPPHTLSISNAVQLLKSISCLTPDEDLTLVGQAVSQLPMNPRMGRMILMGCLCGVGPSILTTAAAMGYRDPFIMPATDQQRFVLGKVKLRLSQNCPSDQITTLKAIEGFHSVTQRSSSSFTPAANRYCEEFFLSHSTMAYMSQLVHQLKGSLSELGVQMHHPFTQRLNGNLNLIMAIIGTGLYPDVGVRRLGNTVYTTEKGCKAKVHPSSTNAKSLLCKTECKTAVECMGFQDLIASQAQLNSNVVRGATLAMLSTSPVSVFSILLTCGVVREVETEDLNDSDGDSDSDEEEAVVVRGRNFRGRALPPPKKETKKVVAKTFKGDKTMINVVVELDGWLLLKIRADHLDLVHNARNLLSSAFVDYVRNPQKQLPPAVQRGVDRVAEALSVEQGKIAGR